MSGVEQHLRTARFRTVVMVVWPNGDEIVVEGVCEGHIAEAEMGDAGFGYDSIFIPDDGDGRSFAQMSADEKNVMSHRARAFSALAGALALHSSSEGSHQCRSIGQRSMTIVDNPEFFVASNRWVNMSGAYMHPFTDVKCALRTTERGVFIRQNQILQPSMLGSPWSIPSALRPTSMTYREP